MHRRRNRRGRTLGALIVAGVVASSAYAFTASNTVPTANAGSGSGAISGYTASAVVYTLNATTPTNLDQVAFTLTPAAAGTVKVQLAAAGAWYACTNTAGSVVCNPTVGTQATVAATSTLTVVAAT